MKQSKTALALLTLSSALLISGCGEKRVVTALPIPPERTDCQAATGQRPVLPPEFRIDWTQIATVDQAHAAHDNFVLVLRGREKTISNYVLKLEGDLHQCSLDAHWIREVQAETTR